MSDTLHGVPVPDEIQLRQAIEAAFGPVAKAWDARSQDMLDVLADSSLARAEVRRGVGTIRIAAMLGVLAMLGTGLAVWTTLNADRAERRLFRQLDAEARTAAAAELSARFQRLCAVRGGWVAGCPDCAKGRPGPGKP
jgi:hypothetical protein